MLVKSKNNSKNPYLLQTVERTCAVVEALAASTEAYGLTEIANRVALSKSTVFRILFSMQELGYVEKIPGTDTYRLSTKILQLSAAVLDRMDIRTIARPYLQELLEVTQETLHLGILDQEKIVYIEKLESRAYSIRMYSQIGKRLPVHCSAMGKIMMSSYEDEIISDILARQGFKKYTDATITDINTYLKEITEVREEGVAYDREEHELGLRCIAVGLYDYTRSLVAAISMTIPTVYYNEDRLPFLITELKKTAGAISRQLGYS